MCPVGDGAIRVRAGLIDKMRSFLINTEHVFYHTDCNAHREKNAAADAEKIISK
jgi:hypothetical protein